MEFPPTNIAQLGMGWNIITGTVELGIAIYDTIIMVTEWIREWKKSSEKETPFKWVKLPKTKGHDY